MTEGFGVVSGRMEGGLSSGLLNHTTPSRPRRNHPAHNLKVKLLHRFVLGECAELHSCPEVSQVVKGVIEQHQPTLTPGTHGDPHGALFKPRPQTRILP